MRCSHGTCPNEVVGCGYCERCKAKRRVYDAKRREKCRRENRCLWSCCTAPPVSGGYCEIHNEYHKRGAKRRYARLKRENGAEVKP